MKKLVLLFRKKKTIIKILHCYIHYIQNWVIINWHDNKMMIILKILLETTLFSRHFKYIALLHAIKNSFCVTLTYIQTWRELNHSIDLYLYLTIIIIIIISRHQYGYPWPSLIPPLPIVHCFRMIFRTTSHIGTELLYEGWSWSFCFCASMWRGLQEYTYELVPPSPAVSHMSGSSTFGICRDGW